MIARWRVLLPFQVMVRPSDDLSQQEFQRDGYLIRIRKPYRSQLDHANLQFEAPSPLHEVTEQLAPVEPQPATSRVRIDGEDCVLADVLEVDFWRQSFDRDVGSEDPPTDLMSAVLNSFLARLRVVAQAPQVRHIKGGETISRLTYLNDDETELEQKPGLHRHRVWAVFRAELVAVNSQVWIAISELPDDYTTQRWDDLILDARRLLPDVGPALVLAATAVEIRIEDALNSLASTAVSPKGLWQWITDRGDYRKEPSVGEQLDILMKQLGGHSLKEQPQLWEAWTRLRFARNNFVHKGSSDVDVASTVSLIDSANAIITWIEQYLPAEQRRPYQVPKVATQLTKLFFADGFEVVDMRGRPQGTPPA